MTALDATALATIDEFKDFATDISGTGQDDKLPRWINSASLELEIECAGVVFVKRSFTEKHPGGQRSIWLAHMPIVSVSSISDEEGNTITGVDYFIDEDAGKLIYDGHAFPHARARWKVIYRAGKFDATADVDWNLKEACMMQADYRRNNRRPNITSAARTGRAGNRSRSRVFPETAGLLPEVRAKLRPYLEPVF